MTPLYLLGACLVCWRVAYALTKESCPFKVCAWIRQHFPLGGLTTCFQCASFWTAGAALLPLQLDPVAFVFWTFAISGGAIMLGAYTGATRSN